MKQAELVALPAEALCQACFEPLIQAYKQRMADSGHTLDKGQFYQEMTDGQQALFAWYIYYSHAKNGLPEFYWWSAYFYAQPEIWSQIQAGLFYFSQTNMAHLLNNVDAVLEQHEHPRHLDHFTITRETLYTEPQLTEAIRTLHEQFDQQTPDTIKQIGDYIQQHKTAFIEIES